MDGLQDNVSEATNNIYTCTGKIHSLDNSIEAIQDHLKAVDKSTSRIEGIITDISSISAKLQEIDAYVADATEKSERLAAELNLQVQLHDELRTLSTSEAQGRRDFEVLAAREVALIKRDVGRYATVIGGLADFPSFLAAPTPPIAAAADGELPPPAPAPPPDGAVDRHGRALTELGGSVRVLRRDLGEVARQVEEAAAAQRAQLEASRALAQAALAEQVRSTRRSGGVPARQGETLRGGGETRRMWILGQF